jgi:hypothetical protein
MQIAYGSSQSPSLRAQAYTLSRVKTHEGTSREPTPALTKCMPRWHADSRTAKQEWRQARERVAAEEPNFNVDYARFLIDWDPETHMTKREWHMSYTDVVEENPGAFEAMRLPRNR